MRLAFDLETDGLLPTLTKIHCMSVVNIDSNDTPDLYVGPDVAEGITRLEKADLLTAHNGICFDWEVVERFYPGRIDIKKIWDTLTMARLREPWRRRQRLVDWGNELKVMKGDYKGGWETYSEEMGKYCIQDAEVQRALFNHLEPKLSSWSDRCKEIEHRVAYFVGQQERHGFRLDIPSAQNLDAELAGEEHAKAQELQGVFPPQWEPKTIMVPKRDNKTMGYSEGAALTKIEWTSFNPGSDQAVGRRLEAAGWKPREYTNTGQPKVSEEILATLTKRFPIVDPLIRWKNVNKQRGQIEGWFKSERDSYVHGRVNSNGAYTGRMTHSSPNMANITKKDKRMRAVWLPDEGDVLLGCDAEGLELRMLGNFLFPYDDGAYARAVVDGNSDEGTDAHTMLQKALYLYSRDYAKTFIYAMIYGAGNPKLGRVIKEDAREGGHMIPDGVVALGQKARGNAMRGIRGLKELTESVQAQHKKRGFIRGLDGRKLKTQSNHSCLNTKLQGAGAILMKEALIILLDWYLPKAGYTMRTDHVSAYRSFAKVANVHDEWQFSVHPDDAEEFGMLASSAMVRAGETLGLKVPMAGKSAIGQNWKETH